MLFENYDGVDMDSFLEEVDAFTDARGVTYNYRGVTYTMPIDIFEDYINLGYTNIEVRAIVWRKHFASIFEV